MPVKDEKSAVGNEEWKVTGGCQPVMRSVLLRYGELGSRRMRSLRHPVSLACVAGAALALAWTLDARVRSRRFLFCWVQLVSLLVMVRPIRMFCVRMETERG